MDDGFTSKDGRFVYFSRPSFADVVAINLRTKRIAWRTKIDSYRADHMAISPNGRRLLVSASTARVVNVIDTRTGRIVGKILRRLAAREQLLRDGRKIFHASIGRSIRAPTTRRRTRRRASVCSRSSTPAR